MTDNKTSRPDSDRPRTATVVRPEIQALRAGAALLVVLYHLWPVRVPGGFTGVDVFFVISGFLITSHLAREATSTGSVRLGRFWARRARRLLPAAYLVLASSAVAVFIWIPQIHWVQNFREILASALYFQNWRLALDAVDYLAADNSPSVALHYWTLSVEEQFYVAWPLLMLLGLAIAARLKTRRLTVMTAVVMVATVSSFAYSLWLTYHTGPFAFFSTFARAWEFGAGALLALATAHAAAGRRRVRTLNPRVGAAISWAGLAALLYCGLRFSGSTAFPGTAALLPVLATVAVIAVGVPQTRLSPQRLLKLRFVQWTGDISYPLYLWHWPPIVILPFALGHPLGFEPRIAILVGTFAAAAFTKRFIEDPVRTGRRLGIQRTSVTFGLSLVLAMALAATCLGGIRHADAASERAQKVSERVKSDTPRCFGAASRVPGEPCDNPELDGLLVPDTTAVIKDDANYPGCKATNVITTTCVFGDRTNRTVPRVVVIGDSHARSLLPAFVRLAKQHKVLVTGHVKAGCPWSSNTYTGPNHAIAEECYQWRDSVNDWLKANADKIDIVVTTALSSTRALGSEQRRIAGYAETWRPVTERGTPIVVIKDNPSHAKNTNDCLTLKTTITPDSCATPRGKAFASFDALTLATKVVPGTRIYDFTHYYCNETSCPAVIGGVNVYRDRTHVSNTYMTTLSPYIYARLDQDSLLERRTG
ncbi:acyltransferase family protein [Aeromicrobium sp.]|uniref:acyltransferase family protein n=1 Tax=Aeromicrobium sp. TaxID=1871063 RepID=UPI0019B7923D|nr:acyltransferase family protein [Aeromicrobium sp.]MBC7630648.1 acyltransferase [Aeromicrobium sp.]